MEITTNRFGRQYADPEKCLTFPRGLAGFEHLTRFQIFHEESETDPRVFYLQSLDDPAVTINAALHFDVGAEYDILLSDEDQETLGADGADEIVIICPISKTIESDFRIVPHTGSPILINARTRLGLQIVLGSGQYRVDRIESRAA
jgi:flagellar assembly factor FliW